MAARYFIQLAYRGTHFHGWQQQPNGTSIQSVLSEILTVYFRSPVKVTGAGRTDAGVHAECYFAHFDLPEKIIPVDSGKVIYHLNCLLPQDIAVYSILPVNEDANSRFDAISRTYEYRISRRKEPFLQDLVHVYEGPLDVKAMNDAAKLLLAVSDFNAFAKSKSDAATSICRVSHALWKDDGPLLIFTITADRFLRNMVRAVVGTLMDVGRGRTSIADFTAIVTSGNRCNAGYSVPACGLFLTGITYPDSIFIR